MASADFTIAEFLAWARTKPAGEQYDYCDARGCAVAQFGLETGRPHLVDLSSDELEAVNFELSEAVLGYDAACEDHRWVRTYGGLVQRLEALIPAKTISSAWARPDAYLSDIEQVSA